MEGQKNKSIDVAKILFKSMEQSFTDMKRENFEMNSAALAEKAKALARFLEEKSSQQGRRKYKRI